MCVGICIFHLIFLYRYILLLTDLRRNTSPFHPDHSLLAQAVKVAIYMCNILVVVMMVMVMCDEDEDGWPVADEAMIGVAGDGGQDQ